MKEKPDLTILDLGLPGGVVPERRKSLPHLATTPVIRLVTHAPIRPHDLAQLPRYGLFFAGNCRALSDRAIGLQICDLTKDSAKQEPLEARAIPATVRIGAPVTFSSGRPEYGLLDNWSVPESWGVWGLGTDAALSFRIDPSEGSGPFRVRVLGFAYVNARAQREEIAVYASGHAVGDWAFDIAHNDIDRTVCIPNAAIYPDRRVELRFHNPHPKSPAALGLADDTRELSIGLKSVELLPAAGACP